MTPTILKIAAAASAALALVLHLLFDLSKHSVEIDHSPLIFGLVVLAVCFLTASYVFQAKALGKGSLLPGFWSAKRKSKPHPKNNFVQDPLTGLPTRRALREFVELSISRVQRHYAMFGALFIDLENFKPIRDKVDPSIAERLLVEVARRLSALKLEGGLCARFDESQFFAVIPGLEAVEDLQGVRASYLEELCRPYEIENQVIRLDIRISTCVFPKEAESYDELVRTLGQSMSLQKAEISESSAPKRDDSLDESLYSLLYISDCLLSEEEKAAALDNIQRVSSKNNALKQVSGKLLLKGPYFIQLLEGRHSDLEHLLAKMRLDTRHRNLTLLFFEKIRRRRFDNWFQMPVIEVPEHCPELDSLIIDLRVSPQHSASEDQMIRVFEEFEQFELV